MQEIERNSAPSPYLDWEQGQRRPLKKILETKNKFSKFLNINLKICLNGKKPNKNFKLIFPTWKYDFGIVKSNLSQSN